jgi:hypothetical protein
MTGQENSCRFRHEAWGPDDLSIIPGCAAERIHFIVPTADDLRAFMCYQTLPTLPLSRRDTASSPGITRIAQVIFLARDVDLEPIVRHQSCARTLHQSSRQLPVAVGLR